MSALLAGMASKGVRQGDYLPERFQDTTTRRAATYQALNPTVAGDQFARFADGAYKGMRSGGWSRMFHFVCPFLILTDLRIMGGHRLEAHPPVA